MRLSRLIATFMDSSSCRRRDNNFNAYLMDIDCVPGVNSVVNSAESRLMNEMKPKLIANLSHNEADLCEIHRSNPE